ncbi:hypothetical protein TcasGA2_TC034236 [Tribolium castaneum]|uniref:Uncharacterized protein n=1 Tax=Tribolium castaneum TaxID=7070 RepID=A0A139WC33_TRICA|nr:PREDICTED: uncharacterized protein LOC103314160 [Tribolium castaneum]KYB25466.1 hypothetical protein TcasGA2_TC034236 [Tribolium castaneum]|eukprot:XP_008197530.1 PREDICTED: uncharacterized protein LOC103314160 [Tribolium castaneum]
MLRFIYLLSIFLLSNSQQCLCLQYDYFWRDYIDGEVPRDAIVAGRNNNSENIYIGQAYVHKLGLATCEIFSGVKEVYVPMYGIQKVEDYIKILCGTQQNLYWMSTTSTSLPTLLLDHVAVIGGNEDGQNGKGTLYVGRIHFNGELKIGKIDTFNGTFIHFNNNMKEEHSNSYEILLLKK